MEERKEKEIEYYDKEAQSLGDGEIKEAGSLGGFNPLLLSSYQFLYKLVGELCPNKKVLDYGCGTGLHIPVLSRTAREVVGIDLSETSLAVAKTAIKEEKITNTEVLLMDAENMEFGDNSFDVVFDGAAFSSLDLAKALPEIVRVLNPEGVLMGIETLGHNPLTNFKRWINEKRGTRTSWAADHIFSQNDIERAGDCFEKIDVRFFHIFSWLAFPFLSLPGGTFLLRFLELSEKPLLKISFLRKYSFKVVFVFSRPKKHGKEII